MFEGCNSIPEFHGQCASGGVEEVIAFEPVDGVERFKSRLGEFYCFCGGSHGEQEVTCDGFLRFRE